MRSVNHAPLSDNNQAGCIVDKLSGLPLEGLARESGFVKRTPKKLRPLVMITSFFMLIFQAKSSFSTWAQQVTALSGKLVSKQAIWKRMTAAYASFLLCLIKFILNRHTLSFESHSVVNSLKGKFRRLLIQDSTLIKLPQLLRVFFPGNYSYGEDKSLLKIQAIRDLTNEEFLDLSIGSFRENDQSASRHILSFAKQGDVLVRDMGYFSLETFSELKRRDVGFISRLRFDVLIFDESGQPIDLPRHLKKKGSFDGWVLLGEEKTLKLRLSCTALPQQHAALRRMRARNDRDKRRHHSKDYYMLLGYNIYITTEENLSAQEMAFVYGLRWRIETLFKSWKSNYHLENRFLSASTKEQAEAIAYLMLLFILLSDEICSYYAGRQRLKEPQRKLSILKMTRFICDNFMRLINESLQALEEEILYHCRYDKRKLQSMHLKLTN
jgi:hypothetical protein